MNFKSKVYSFTEQDYDYFYNNLDTISCKGTDTEGYELKEEVSGYAIYVANESLPHVYISNNVNQHLDLNDYATKVSSSMLAENPVFLNSTEPPLNLAIPKTNLECSKKISHQSLNKLIYVVSCNAPTMFVLNEFFTDSWRASVDREKINLLRVNANQIGVALSPGSHLIEFEYYPVMFKYSLLIFIFGIFALVIALLPGKRSFVGLFPKI